MASEGRNFININLKQTSTPGDNSAREKQEQYLRDLERLRKIRMEARKTEPERFVDRPEIRQQSRQNQDVAGGDRQLDVPSFQQSRGGAAASTGLLEKRKSDRDGKLRYEERKREEREERVSIQKEAMRREAVQRETAQRDVVRNGRKSFAGEQNDKRRRHTRNAEKKLHRKNHFVRNAFAVIIAFLFLWGCKNLFLSGDTHESGYYTVAVFGVDSRDGNLKEGALSDVNMIVSLNKETGDIHICSVYRDTFVQIDEKGKHHKFNEAYFKGGPEQALWTMKYNLDIAPDDYITFNWKAVIDAINIMGGVDLDITEPEFKYINSFITETVNATGIGSVQLKHAGQNHLDGVQAVAYARLRLMDTDYNRTERQRRIVSLLMDKVRTADVSKRMELVTSVIPETRTSMTIDDLLIYAKDIKKYHLTETAGFPFEKDTAWIEKKDCVVPITMETNVIALHQFLFGIEDYQASSSVREISDYIIKKTGLKAKDNAPEVSLDQKNGGSTGEKRGKEQSAETAAQNSETAKETAEETEEDAVQTDAFGQTERTEEETGINTDAPGAEEFERSESAETEEISASASASEKTLGDESEIKPGHSANIESSSAVESIPRGETAPKSGVAPRRGTAPTPKPSSGTERFPAVSEPEIGPGIGL